MSESESSRNIIYLAAKSMQENRLRGSEETVSSAKMRVGDKPRPGKSSLKAGDLRILALPPRHPASLRNSFGYEIMAVMTKPTADDPMISERLREGLRIFLEALRTKHECTLAKFAEHQLFTDNILSRIGRGDPVRRSLYDQIVQRANDLNLEFMPVRLKRLEELVRDGLHLEEKNSVGLSDDWGGDYVLLTRLDTDRVGVAEFRISRRINRFDFTSFRVKRRHHSELLLIRGIGVTFRKSLYFQGFSYDPALPRSIALQVSSSGSTDLLVGAMSGSTNANLAFTAPCTAVPISISTRARIQPGFYPLAQVADLSPDVHLYLSKNEPHAYPRHEFF